MYYKETKYHSRKVTLDGITFDSQREANRYAELKMLERAGCISNLRLQVKYAIVEPHKREDGTTERGAFYIADFAYFGGEKEVVEDAKGYRTPEYILKRKLMLERYGIRILET